MANNELTYNDFLQRLNIQELLVYCHRQWQVLFSATRAEELQRDRFHQGASDAV